MTHPAALSHRNECNASLKTSGRASGKASGRASGRAARGLQPTDSTFHLLVKYCRLLCVTGPDRATGDARRRRGERLCQTNARCWRRRRTSDHVGLVLPYGEAGYWAQDVAVCLLDLHDSGTNVSGWTKDVTYVCTEGKQKMACSSVNPHGTQEGNRVLPLKHDLMVFNVPAVQ
ncbi:hypothetical protein DPEC_G00299540 [Dallia pectoralis]|uniref:Uncharacterized protein n=1 Tax=Dallia pectoralis TaxID=75939 RepID=A0ACC2FGI4_DALPE|nr:hypothetical protein DPEC_G00299540 [Dallia pectoralis]